jgi:predicted nuclease of predicted toxin-antitoxin system
MAEKIRFHLDKNVRNAVAQGLRRRVIDVTTTPEQSLIGVSDRVQLEFAISQNRVIFTQDTDFLRMNRTNSKHCGIVYNYQGNRSIGEIIKGLILIDVFISPNVLLNQ